MPRRPRSIVGGYVYHVLNRANGRLRLFKKQSDYEAFERVVVEVQERTALRILAYVVMSNHWHFVVWPKRGDDRAVSEFFRLLTVTHTQRWHAAHRTSGTGHLYQGRYKSFPVAADEHLTTLMRYVERNPLRASLVDRAEDWRWGSLYRRTRGMPDEQSLLSEPPVPLGRAWVEHVNAPQTEAELAVVRSSIVRGRPLGDEAWQRKTAGRLDLEHTFRPRGRPRKTPPPDAD